jgi:hypothetical protein
LTTISIVTAVYNRRDTLGDALGSLQRQSYDDVQHILIDGGSDDGSVELARARATPRTVILSEPDNGIYDALNKGLSHATGDVVGLLHSDDVFAHDDVLAHVAAAFEASTDAVYGSSPASPVRTAPTSPSCCWRRATRCTASSAAARCSTPSGSTTSTRTRTSRTSASEAALRRPDRLLQPHPHHAGGQPDEIYNLGAQSHVAVSFEAGIHRQRPTPWARCGCWRPSASWGWRRRPASTRPRPPSLRQGAGDPAARDHALLPALALRRGQALCLLDHGELPRGLRASTPATASCSTTRARRGETFVTRKITRGSPISHQARPASPASTWATSTRCATGAMPRTTCACSG